MEINYLKTKQKTFRPVQNNNGTSEYDYIEFCSIKKLFFGRFRVIYRIFGKTIKLIIYPSGIEEVSYKINSNK